MIQSLRKSKRTLCPQGMGACRLVKNEAMLGRLAVIFRYVLAPRYQPDTLCISAYHTRVELSAVRAIPLLCPFYKPFALAASPTRYCATASVKRKVKRASSSVAMGGCAPVLEAWS